MSGALPRNQSVASSLGGASVASLRQLVGDIRITDADVAQNHGIGCAPVRGRESHTADLDCFDRYVHMMQTEREAMAQGKAEEVEEEKEEKLEEVADADDGASASSTTPFHAAFWEYVRSILANAKPVVPLECILPDGSPLQIRVGIHCGPAIVVPVNGVNDFFGQTVNIASRVEAAAKASECFITEDVLKSDPDSRNAYYEIVSSSYSRRGSGGSDAQPGTGKQVFVSTSETELHLKGVKEVVKARGFRLNSRPRRASDMMGGEEPLRVYRKSEMFSRVSITGSSDRSLDTDDEQSSANQRRMSKRTSDLVGVQEEEADNPFDADDSASSQ